MGKYLNSTNLSFTSNKSMKEIQASIQSLQHEGNRVEPHPIHSHVFEIKSVEKIWWISSFTNIYNIYLTIDETNNNTQIKSSVSGNLVLNFLNIFFIFIIPIWCVMAFKIGLNTFLVIFLSIWQILVIFFFIKVNLKYRKRGEEQLEKLKEKLQ